MSVTDLAPADPRRTAQRTVGILDQVLDHVREALARASVVPDPADAACELRALASTAWEAAERIQPLDAEQIVTVADAIGGSAVAGEEPAVLTPPTGLSDAAPGIEYRPRHSASIPVPMSRLAVRENEPTSITMPPQPAGAASRLARPAVDACVREPALGTPPEPTGDSIADRLAALDALLLTSERLLGGA